MTEEIRIPRALLDEMITHCMAGRPNEACGILAVRDGNIVEVVPMFNVKQSPMRYAFDDRQLGKAAAAIYKKGSEIGASFHSHTRTEAYPSPTDVREARWGEPYVIVSLADEGEPVVRAFRILKEDWEDAEGEIQEVPVVVDG